MSVYEGGMVMSRSKIVFAHNYQRHRELQRGLWSHFVVEMSHAGIHTHVNRQLGFQSGHCLRSEMRDSIKALIQ